MEHRGIPINPILIHPTNCAIISPSAKQSEIDNIIRALYIMYNSMYRMVYTGLPTCAVDRGRVKI